MGRLNPSTPSPIGPETATGDHLEFALKYDGVNLGILSALFDAVPADEISGLDHLETHREIRPQDLVPV